MITEEQIITDLAAVRERIARLEAENARLRASAPMRYTYPADAAIPAAEALAQAHQAAERAATAVLRACARGEPAPDRARRAILRAWRLRRILREVGHLAAYLADDCQGARDALAGYGVSLLDSEPTADGVHALVARLACEAEHWRATAMALAPAPVVLAQHIADAQHAAPFGGEGE